MFLYMEDAERAAFVKKLRERAAQLPITPEHNQLSNITLAFLEFCGGIEGLALSNARNYARKVGIAYGWVDLLYDLSYVPQ